MTDIVIAAALRTAIGKFGGTLAKTPAPELGATVIRALLAKTNLKPEQISEVILGQVLAAGSGQNPARQALIKSGLPVSVPAMTINKVCGSGLKAVMLAAQAVRCGDADIVIAGGQENMSASPHVLLGSRDGFRMGDAKLIDSMIVDGLVGCLQSVSHGHDGRERREAIRHRSRAAGRIRGREPEQGRSRAESRQVQGRNRSGDDSAAQGRSGRVRERRIHQGGNDAGIGQRPQARLRQGWIGHRGQCLGTQRRRRRGPGDERGTRGAARVEAAGKDQGVRVVGRRSCDHGHGAGAGVAPLPGKGRMEARGPRPDGNQRGVCGAGLRRQQGDGLGYEQDQRQRRSDRAGPSDRRFGLPRAGHAAARDGAPGREERVWRRCASAAAWASPSRSNADTMHGRGQTPIAKQRTPNKGARTWHKTSIALRW